MNELTYGRSNWFDRVKDEHLACRENVALFDMSAFAKLEIEVCPHTSMILTVEEDLFLPRIYYV